MLRPISTLLLLVGAAQALPWDGPCPTSNAEVLPLLRDYDFPIPTAAAELRKRQEPGDVLCAWEDGDADSSMALYCRSQKVCATNSLGVFGCCDEASVDDCPLITTCIDSTAADAYASSYGTDSYALTCNLPQNPICITEYIELAVTVTGWLCGPTTSANPQTYYPSDYNITAASTETPIYRNAVFDGYTPLTLLNPTTSTSSSSTPSTTTAPSTTSSPSPTSTSSTSTTSPSTPTPSPSSSSTPIGAIVGGVIGGIAVIGIIVILAILLIRRRNKQNNTTAATATAAQSPYPDGGVAPMHQIPQGSPPLQQNPQYPMQPDYRYGDPALQQQQQQQQYAHPQPYNTDAAAAGAGVYPAAAAYPEKSPAQTTVSSPQMSNYSPAVPVGGGAVVGQDHRSSTTPLYSPTASELGGGAVMGAKGPVHELGE